MLLASTTATFAQETAAPQDSIAQLRSKWQSLDQQIKTLDTQIQQAELSEVEPLRSERYRRVAEANEVVNRLEQVAQKTLLADRTSKAATRALMGIALNAAMQDDDQRALTLGDFLIQQGINPKYFEIASKSESLSIEQREIFDELLIRYDEAMQNDLPRVELKTTKGEIVIELFENQAPGAVGNFISLVREGYYDNLLFHRVIEDFIAQTGGFRLDEDGDEVGGKGPGYNIKCECKKPDKRLHFTGCVSMAHLGPPNTGGSEFFMTLRRVSGLDGKHTVFGRIIKGLDVLENLERTHQISRLDNRDIPIAGVLKDMLLSAKVIRARPHVYQPDKVEPQAGSSNGTSDESNSSEEDDDSADLDLNSPDDGGQN